MTIHWNYNLPQTATFFLLESQSQEQIYGYWIWQAYRYLCVMNAQNDDVRGPFSQLAFCRFSFEAPLFIIELPVVSKKLISFVEKSSWSNFKYFELQGYVYPVQEHVVTLYSRLFEPALIRIIWSFEVRWRSPWICYPNSWKTLSFIRTSVIQTFSYSKRFLFSLGPIIV